MLSESDCMLQGPNELVLKTFGALAAAQLALLPVAGMLHEAPLIRYDSRDRSPLLPKILCCSERPAP